MGISDAIFFYGIRIGIRGQWGKVYLGCISETVICRKLILGRDGGLGVQCHGGTLI